MTQENITFENAKTYDDLLYIFRKVMIANYNVSKDNDNKLPMESRAEVQESIERINKEVAHKLAERANKKKEYEELLHKIKQKFTNKQKNNIRYAVIDKINTKTKEEILYRELQKMNFTAEQKREQADFINRYYGWHIEITSRTILSEEELNTELWRTKSRSEEMRYLRKNKESKEYKELYEKYYNEMCSELAKKIALEKYNVSDPQQ